ncbi:hypothetical protein N7541_011180 [Penicillium brevicompactum]|uniref:Bul1 C-terminal domain-containing protein n=1 Tax=Penicillium brevicompactum TaxID=5074 RepID=A0A9W9QQ11_PENBR|nr:hypothetical protein N7541_011180 [Penicillium brevicompactum]
MDQAISVTICLNGAAASTSYVTSFSTGGKIEGNIAISPNRNTRFHDMEIFLLGDEYTTVNHAKTHRRFLNVQYPIQDHSLPSPRVLEKDQKYQIPFSFTVADHLPMSACDHETAGHAVRKAHLRPPPSFGDAMVAGYGGKLRDDFAPRECRIVYTIQFNLRRSHLASGQISTIFTDFFKLRIKPSTPAEPYPNQSPIRCIQDSPFYGKQTILPGRAKSTLGTLSMAIEEPTSFRLPLHDPTSLISSSIRINVVYTAESELIFPQFRSVGGHLTSTTVFTNTCHTDFPEKKKNSLGRALNYHVEQFPPFTNSFSSLDWRQESESNRYSATLLVPITLPRQNLIPTFHTCLISRIYHLHIKVVVKDGAPFEFKIPAHIFAREDPSHLPSYDATVGLDQDQEILLPETTAWLTSDV